MYLRKGCSFFMDCMTISTFRSLEQQAIRQYKESKLKDNNRQVYFESFRRENTEIAKAHRVNNESNFTSKICNKILNYFA